jgi:hypothetical protein
MTNTDRAEVVANYIFTMMQDNATALGVEDVWYGDQTLLPKTPAICVSPGDKKRIFQGSSYRTLNTFETYVMVYWGQIQDIQANLHSCTNLADDIETLVHSDLTLGGNVFSVICMQNQPGIANKQGALLVGARLTFESMSKTTFPTQVVP